MTNFEHRLSLRVSSAIQYSYPTAYYLLALQTLRVSNPKEVVLYGKGAQTRHYYVGLQGIWLFTPLYSELISFFYGVRLGTPMSTVHEAVLIR